MDTMTELMMEVMMANTKVAEMEMEKGPTWDQRSAPWWEGLLVALTVPMMAAGWDESWVELLEFLLVIL